MSQLFSTFDPSELGDALVLSSANQIVTFYVGGSNIHRMVRCLYPQSTYLSFAEFVVFASQGSSPTLAGNCSIGVVNVSAPLTKYVGEDANGYGLRLAEGAIYNNGSSVLSVSACALNDIIGIEYDSSALSLIFFRNGASLGNITLPNSGPWYLAASIGGTVANTMLIFMNAGQQQFKYPPINIDGWWTPVAQVNKIAIASEDYTSLDTDTVPNQPYDGAIDPQNAQQLSISRIVNFWPWRTSTAAVSGGQSWGSLLITDPKGIYDNLLTTDVRDSQIQILRAPVGSSLDSAQILATAVVDHVQSDGDFQKAIYIKDSLALLDKPVQRSLELPNVDVSAVGRPEPITIGACRNVPGLLLDATTHTYQFTDVPIAGIGDVRVAGKLLSPVGTPADYTLSADGKSLVLNVDPLGKLTAEIAGLNSVSPPSPTDLLGGAGHFDTMPDQAYMDTLWTRGSQIFPPPTEPIWINTAGYGQVKFKNIAFGLWNYIYSLTNWIQAGKSYALKLHIDQMSGTHIGVYSTPFLAYLGITGYIYGSPLWASIYKLFPNPPGGWNVHPPADITVFFTNNQGVDLPLVIEYIGNDDGSPNNFALLKSAELYALPDAITAGSPSLQGVNLETYMRNIVETHLGLPGSAWNAGDAAAIDTKTGYGSIGHHIEQPTSGRNALQPVLDTYCADLYVDRSGVIRVARLVAPESVTPSGIIDETIIVGQISGGNMQAPQSMIGIENDLAAGLTTTMSARKNWAAYTDGDFGSTSLADCPNTIRALLKLPYQSIAPSGAQLSNMYLAARQGEPLPGCFDLETEAQTEIDRVCGIYTVNRSFYAIPVKSDTADSYDIGQVWTLKYPRYGLDNGKPVYIYGVIEQPLSEQCTLLCFG